MKEFEVYLFGKANPLEETLKVETLEELRKKVAELSERYYLCAFVDLLCWEVWLGSLCWAGHEFKDNQPRALYVEDVVKQDGTFELYGPHGKLNETVKANSLEELTQVVVKVAYKHSRFFPLVELESGSMFVGHTDWDWSLL